MTHSSNQSYLERLRTHRFSVGQYGDPDYDSDDSFQTAVDALSEVRRRIVKHGECYVEWNGTVHRERWSATIGFHRTEEDSLEFMSRTEIDDPRADDEGTENEVVEKYSDGYPEMIAGCAAKGYSTAVDWLTDRLKGLDEAVASITERGPRPAVLDCAPRPRRNPVRMLMRRTDEFYGDDLPRWTGLADREGVERTIAQRLDAIRRTASDDPAEIKVQFERSMRRGGTTTMLSAGVRSNQFRVPECSAMATGSDDVTGTADRTTTEATIAAGWIVDALIAGGYDDGSARATATTDG